MYKRGERALRHAFSGFHIQYKNRWGQKQENGPNCTGMTRLAKFGEYESAYNPAGAGIASRVVLRIEEGNRDTERHARVREEPVPDVNADMGKRAPLDIEKYKIPES